MKKLYTVALVCLLGVLLGSSIAKADALFTKDLYFGIQGDSEVTKLQEFLTDQGVYSGPITGNFFSLSLAGVKNFQSREGITPAAGYFVPITRAKANAILSLQLRASNGQGFTETGSLPPISTPSAVTNDTGSSLQAQLNALLKQIALLQAQLNGKTVSTSSQATATTTILTSLTITSISPTAILNSTGNLINISGRGFKPGLSVNASLINLPVAGDVRDDGFAFRVPEGMTPGIYNVMVVNPDGKNFVLPSALIVQSSVAAAQSGDIPNTEIVSRARGATVLIRAQDSAYKYCGSGVVFDNSGYVLTNAHVVRSNSGERFNSVNVFFSDGRNYTASVVGRNEIIDLAVLKISGSNFTSISFGDSDASSLPQLSEVLALGYPLTCITDITFVSEQGYITTRRVISSHTYEMLQTSALIHSGNSGGPLMNKKAEVVGINTAGNDTIGINFAIPVNIAKGILNDLKNGSQILLTSVIPLPPPSPSPSPTPQPSPLPTPQPGSLTVAKNPALGTQNISANSTNVKIGSYAFSASSASAVTVSSLTITVGTTASLQNLKVMVGGTQFGVTQGTVSAGGTYSFSGTPFTVPAGGTTYVDVYADILSSAASVTPATTLSGCTANGVATANSISCNSITGQGITIAGQPAIAVAADSATPAAGQLVMGSTGNVLATFRFTETSNVENVKITDINVFDSVTATNIVKSGFGNLSLYQGTTLVGTAGSAVTGAGGVGYLYFFHFATPIVVPQANSITLTLKGDVSSYASSGATDNTAHTFGIMTTSDPVNDTTAETVVALGNSSNATSTVTISSANGNAQTLLRSKLTVTGTALGSSSGRSKTAIDDLGTLNLAADSAGAVTVSTITITFTGSAPSSTSPSNNFWATGGTTAPQNTCAGGDTCNVQLYDSASGVSYYAVASVAGTSMTFNLNGYTVSAGTSKSFTIRVNSTAGTKSGTSGVAQTLSMTINAVGDVRWADALDAAVTSNLGLTAIAVPVTIQSVSYAAGT